MRFSNLPSGHLRPRPAPAPAASARALRRSAPARPGCPLPRGLPFALALGLALSAVACRQPAASAAPELPAAAAAAPAPAAALPSRSQNPAPAVTPAPETRPAAPVAPAPSGAGEPTAGAALPAAPAPSGAGEPTVGAALPAPVAAAGGGGPAPDVTWFSPEGLAGLVGTEHFGLYLGGKKAGFVRNELRLEGDRLVCATHMTLRVAMLGQAEETQLGETRIYALAPPGQLQSVEAHQTAPTGAVEVRAAPDGERWLIRTRAGGAETTLRVPPPQETLAMHLGAQALVLDPQAAPGRTLTGRVFEVLPPLLGEQETRLTLVRREPRLLAGVEAQVAVVRAELPALGLAFDTWLDPAGRVLESQVGGLLTLRREPAELAERADYQADVLVATQVPVDRDLGDPVRVTALDLRISGLAPDLPLPQTARDRAERAADGSVTWRSRTGPGAAAEATGAALPADPPTAAHQAADALIQAAAPAIRREARAIVKAARATTPEARARAINRWVHENVKKSFVPALSNALDVLRTRQGDCSEHAVLAVALLRAAGVPARIAAGLAYWPAGRAFAWHAWTEAYVDGRWLALDPAWGQDEADATHLRLASGNMADLVRLVPQTAGLRIKVLDVRRGPAAAAAP